MKILSIHNFYQKWGGEDQNFQAEAALLEEHGNTVFRYEERNDPISNGWLTGIAATWNQRHYSRIVSFARNVKPDIVHFHNTFPRISPAAYYATRSLGLPAVQKVSNFRLLCPGATLMRDGKVCETCLERKSLLPAIHYGCYRGNRAASAAVVSMLATHRTLGTWQNMVDLYLVPTAFTRQKLIEGGLPADRMIVKPHMVSPDPGPGCGSGGYALFVGRLSQEKGIDTLARAWKSLSDIPLRVAGDGPLSSTVWPKGVTWLGSQTRPQIFDLMKRARAVLIPSTWYEIAPLTLTEAFACGTPVIASDLGSMAEGVDHLRTGLLFRPGDPEDLARQVRWAWEHPEQLQAMRVAARREYEQKYTPERNYKLLMEAYDLAIENFQRRLGGKVRAAASAGGRGGEPPK